MVFKLDVQYAKVETTGHKIVLTTPTQNITHML